MTITPPTMRPTESRDPEIWEDEASLNPATATHLDELVARRLSRRRVLAGGWPWRPASSAVGCWAPAR